VPKKYLATYISPGNALRRLSSAKQPAHPPVKADIDPAEWLREQQHQAAGEEPGDPVATGEAQPAAPRAPAPKPLPPLLDV
jgi:hypothetical protein